MDQQLRALINLIGFHIFFFHKNLERTFVYKRYINIANTLDVAHGKFAQMLKYMGSS